MKRLWIITLAIVCLGVYQPNYAEIRNGYKHEIIKVEKWLTQLHKIANGPLSESKQIKMEKKLDEAYEFMDNLREKHAKTQDLIEKLRMIAPDLYHEINTIKDSESNETDVYIKVVDDLGLDLRGATNVSQSIDNPNTYSSEYGDFTVSIWIINTDVVRALWILAHELGHVRYQVPHLAEYAAFFQKVYQQRNYKSFQIGHHMMDPSQQSVQETMRIFKKSWKEYHRTIKGILQDKSQKMVTSYKGN